MNPWDDSAGEVYEYLTITDSEQRTYSFKNILIDIVFAP
jgi:hypothetical protein